MSTPALLFVVLLVVVYKSLIYILFSIILYILIFVLLFLYYFVVLFLVYYSSVLLGLKDFLVYYSSISWIVVFWIVMKYIVLVYYSSVIVRIICLVLFFSLEHSSTYIILVYFLYIYIERGIYHHCLGKDPEILQKRDQRESYKESLSFIWKSAKTPEL